jgi:YidC/Oxa1 family membrane protein insertase
MIPPEGEKNSLLFSAKDGTVTTKLSIPWDPQPVTYTVYVGPKEPNALNAVNPALDRAIDFGWSHFIARPLLSLLKLSHAATGNYGLDIILLTVLVKLAFFPLSAKAFRSMNEMKKIQPQLEQLREQFKDDREKLNREMMELYRRNHINPLGGCLPMVVQIPVFIGLYQAFMHAIELRQAPFFGWIQDLSQPDRLGSMWLPLVDPPGIPVLTLLMGGTMVAQQAMTPMPGDPVQQKMMMIMPLMFTVMFVNFPAGLVLYWLVNNVLSIAQQYAQNKGLV